MMKKVPNQQSGDIRPITFQNDDPIDDQIDNTGKSSYALKPK